MSSDIEGVIDVNDVLEELREENNKLSNELTFANKCIKVLIDLKINFDLHSKKFKTVLSRIQWQKFEELIDNINQNVFNFKAISSDKPIKRSKPKKPKKVVPKPQPTPHSSSSSTPVLALKPIQTTSSSSQQTNVQQNVQTWTRSDNIEQLPRIINILPKPTQQVPQQPQTNPTLLAPPPTMPFYFQPYVIPPVMLTTAPKKNFIKIMPKPVQVCPPSFQYASLAASSSAINEKRIKCEITDIEEKFQIRSVGKRSNL